MKTNINIFNNLNESLKKELKSKRKSLNEKYNSSKKIKSLKEGAWKLNLDGSIRKAIRNEDYEGIIAALKHYNEVVQNSPKADDFIKEEFQRFIDDYEMDFEDLFADDDPEEVLDYILSEFYDMCDNLGVFIELTEADNYYADKECEYCGSKDLDGCYHYDGHIICKECGKNVPRIELMKKFGMTEAEEETSEVESLANEIYEFYDNDMGTHFDEVLGNEEEVYNNTLAMLEHKEENKEALQKILEEIRESNEGLANKLEKFLNESSINETENEDKLDEAKPEEKLDEPELNEEEVIRINDTEIEPDYLIQDVTVLDQVSDGDVQSPDIEALLTLVDSALKESYSKEWGHIKTLSSKIEENSSYALVDISTSEILKEFKSKGIKDVAIGKNLILEKVDDKLVEFKVNSLNGTTKYSKKTTNPQQAIYEWLESEFLQEAKEEKAKEAEVAKAKTEKETVENYINNRLDLKMEIENIKMFIDLSKQVKAEEEMKPAIQNRMYAFAVEVPYNIEVTNKDDKYELSFSNVDEVVAMIFGKEWVKETTPDNEVVGVIKESQKLTEAYEQFNIGEIEVVFNPDTYETLYSIPSADVQDKKINLTKVPTVDTPYDTDTIIKSYIETRFGRIPTEEEKEMIDNGEVSEPQPEESEPAPETPEIPQEEEISQEDININEPDLTEDELPDEPEENEIPSEIESEEEETPEAETGSAVFMKIRPKQNSSVEDLRKRQLDGDTPTSNYIVVDTLELSPEEFNDLVNNLSGQKSYLEGIQALDRKNYSFNVIKITSSDSNFDLLIDPLGYNYPRYVAISDKS